MHEWVEQKPEPEPEPATPLAGGAPACPPELIARMTTMATPTTNAEQTSHAKNPANVFSSCSSTFRAIRLPRDVLGRTRMGMLECLRRDRKVYEVPHTTRCTLKCRNSPSGGGSFQPPYSYPVRNRRGW